MASDVLRDLFVRIGVKTDKAQFDRAQKSIETMKSGLLQIGAGAAVLAGGVYAARKFMESMTKVGDEAREAAQSVGTTVAAIQTLQYVGGLAGVSSEGIITALKFLGKNSYDAAKGGKEAAEAFAAVGVSVKNADGSIKDAEPLLAEIADRFKDMPNGAAKTALAMKIFGRSGADMIPMLNGGAEAIRNAREELKALGVLLTDDEAKAMDEFNDELGKVDKAAQGLGMTIAKALLPDIKDLVVWIREKLKVAIEWMQKHMGLVKAAAVGFGAVIAGLGFGLLVAGLVKVAIGLAGVATAFTAAGTAGLWAFAKMVAIPLIIGAGIAAIILIIEDLWLALTDPEAITEFRGIIDYWKSEFLYMIATVKKTWQDLQDFIFGKNSQSGLRGGVNAPLKAAEVDPARLAKIPDFFPAAGSGGKGDVNIGEINITASGATISQFNDDVARQTAESIKRHTAGVGRSR